MKNFLLKTKGNSLHNSNGKPTRKYLVWIVVAFLVLYGGRTLIGTLTSFVTAPFFHVRTYLETSRATIPAFFRSRNELLARIQSLEQELAQQQGREALYSYTFNENVELRKLLGASTSTPQVVAGVISRPPYTPYDTLILDKGATDGIVALAPVFYGSRMALGYVSAVYPHTAVVTLFSSPGVESTVYVFGPNVFTTAFGEGAGVVRLSIPQGIAAERGNLVALPSLESGILGTIDDIQSTPTEPEQRAYVTLSLSLQSIRLVSVGTQSVEPASLEEAQDHTEEVERTLFTVPVPQDVQVASTTLPTPVSTSSTMHRATSSLPL